MAFGSDRSRFVDNQISGKRLADKLDRFDCVNADFVYLDMGISSGSVGTCCCCTCDQLAGYCLTGYSI